MIGEQQEPGTVNRKLDADRWPAGNDQPLAGTSSPALRLVVSPRLLLALGIAVYILIFTAAAWYKYDSYLMGFDLGVHEQVLWNTAHGRIAASSAFAMTTSYFGIDIIPTELLLTPLYALFPSAYTMLLLQSTAAGLGALPVFLIVRGRFAALPPDAGAGQPSAAPVVGLRFADLAGLAFAAAFLLYLPVEYTTLYEFQIRAFATTFLLWAFYALERRRFWPFLGWSLLALGCRAEVGLVLAGMGVYAWTHGRHRRDALPSGLRVSSATLKFGVLPIVLGLGWLVLCLEVLVPLFRNGTPSLYLSVIYGKIGDQPWLGDSPGEIMRTLITRPGFVLQEVFGPHERGALRIRYLIEMFLPFGFLLLLQPRLLLITLPIFAINLLSNTPNIHASTHYHYQALIVPFMVVGSAYGLHRLIGWLMAGTQHAAHRAGALRLPTVLLIGLLGLALACNIGFRNPLFSLLGRDDIDRGRIAVIERLLARVPPDAALAATNAIGPHAARRERIFFFPGNVIYPTDNVFQAGFLLIDEADLLRDAKDRRRRVQLLEELPASGYRLLVSEQGVSLWERVE